MDQRTKEVLQLMYDAQMAMQSASIKGNGMDPRFLRAVRRGINEIERLDRRITRLEARDRSTDDARVAVR